jgi:hypothetical protein
MTYNTKATSLSRLRTDDARVAADLGLFTYVSRLSLELIASTQPQQRCSSAQELYEH